MREQQIFPPEKMNTGSQKLGRVILQLQRLERQPRTFGEAGVLTPSEIHTIDAIGCEGGILMSALASRLGVTKGAVTQLVTRLEAKALVTRTTHPTDSRAVMVSLTEKGKVAYRIHEEMHHEFYQQLRLQLDPDEIAVFEKCLDKLSELLRD
ncbi:MULTISPECIES: MarR family winged helix-turn-helix transcriptional regulator [Brevibacillus]|uniref:MarR family transcriptional regulator n=1 Tax=Brevibacillus borstelensis AK1 TaxID=1300222 RepID=M8DLW8_9BACL|nr:MarR family transcriptional regulator [Brevibacillus borstelensis]EMT54593.1 MarR family transcriptional regulator [Brevibacillus borstelensis AK1]MED1876063.1 MarR family transcriptional regulator [Brevibacillus borstelensis]MED1881916.1 MarR family transcriptional regulator [Brevibacillus borstelensis]MED2008363.1 MarR family transcriptional regulator [Brevibacillus borstelensis]WNF07595.1 MarR family transcriptional regulator [Brevibacillus borstelensis]